MPFGEGIGMMNPLIPTDLPNWINGQQKPAETSEYFNKLNPATGELLCRVARSRAADIEQAVAAAESAQPAWGDTPAVQRGMILHKIVVAMQQRQEDIARVVHLETGKSYKDALGETGGAIALGLFYASEGQRLYGKTATSGTPNKFSMIIRQPVGVAGLIVPGNTPIANVAWKVFPALVCGNAVVLKAAEDTPVTAWIFSEIAHAAGLPAGLLNVVQGYGEEAGAPLVEHASVGVISFTGSTEVGRYIQQAAGKRLAKVSLELGGKNPFVVADDADLVKAVNWAALSAFSNAGQRCAAGSRMIVFEGVYDQFKQLFIAKINTLKVGPGDGDDFGPVINQDQLDMMLGVIERARQNGAVVLTGGYQMKDAGHQGGFYLAPTLIENVGIDDEISQKELFGPVTCLHRAVNFDDALAIANHTSYGLTACIHTRSLHRGMLFCQKVQAGVTMVNAATYGSEPHMPFGGLKDSGNGTREPGSEALDIYSDIKVINFLVDPGQV
jgi:alpha-ketoglutaric semialdehyde dehydrogenase